LPNRAERALSLRSETAEYVTEAVRVERLAPAEELERIVREWYGFVEDDETLLSAPRCVEVWGASNV
jgi:hypothetical protein